MKILLVIAVLAILSAGCASKATNSGNGNSSPNPGKPGSNTNDPAGLVSAPGTVKTQSGPDFSTPKSTVETFIRAAERRDVEVLSQCFDPQSAGEFKSLHDKTASPDDLDQLANQVGDGLVLDTTEKGDLATVKAKFPMGMEEVSLKKSAAGWKILNF